MHGIDGKLLNRIKSFYVNNRACVKSRSKKSDWCGMLLRFNTFMDGVLRKERVCDVWKRCKNR